MPISSTPTRDSSGRRRSETGTPTWLLKLPTVLPTGNSTASMWAMASLAVVLPALPVTPTMRPPRRPGFAGRRGNPLPRGCWRLELRVLLPLRWRPSPSPAGRRRGHRDWARAARRKDRPAPACGCPRTSRCKAGPGGPAQAWRPAPLRRPRRSMPGSFRLPMVTETSQHSAGHLAIVESDGLVFQYLVSFVSLSGKNHNVAGTRFLDGAGDGGGAVRLDDVRHVGAPDAHQRIVHNVERIFRARIVAGQHDEIAVFRGRLPHQRTLRAVAVAAAPE